MHHVMQLSYPFMSCVCACTCCSAHTVSAFARTTAFLHGRPGFPPAPGSALRQARLLVQSVAHTMLHTTTWHVVDALPPRALFAEVLNCSQGVRRFPNASVCSVGARVIRFSALDCGMLANHLHAVSLSKVPVGATAVGQVARVRVRVLSRTTRLPHPNTSATPPPTRDHFALSLRFAHQSLFFSTHDRTRSKYTSSRFQKKNSPSSGARTPTRLMPLFTRRTSRPQQTRQSRAQATRTSLPTLPKPS